MNNITVKITAGGKTIELGRQGAEDDDPQKDVNELEVWMDTLNDNAVAKGTDMLPRMTIKGDITAENMSQLQEVFLWTKDDKSDTQYREVEATLWESADKVARRYKFGKMFVCDFKETYGKETKGEQLGTFVLTLNQYDNSLSKAQSFLQ